jgi:ComF family protein
MKNLLSTFYAHFLDFAYPRICVACEKQSTESESAICFDCLWSLPKTNSHNLEENVLENKFWGKVKMKNVNAFLVFSKSGKVQNILHSLKYRNNPDLAEFLGKYYGTEIKETFSADVLIPIPLHKERLRERGYNQAECFAKGLSESLEVPVMSNALIRNRNSITQTKTGGRFNRYKNIEDIFSVSEDSASVLKNKKVVLVDDVLTSGATIEVAAKVLHDAGIKELSVITIAAAL